MAQEESSSHSKAGEVRDVEEAVIQVAMQVGGQVLREELGQEGEEAGFMYPIEGIRLIGEG